MALNGNPVAFAQAAQAEAEEARELFTLKGDAAQAKLAEAVANLSWAVAVMADRQGMNK
ncbi:hypothetical protein [Ornithinimicrobium ciconiae]|uniref:hypothetical protein n=1 Tax=Ornithinimicrobium ciconiae TaxID=2594265 RepID=UPI0013FD015C|nr:hypothetical protein [Ornithinimicrobium ciconiae]